MKKIILSALLVLGLFALQNTDAQSIIRSTTCSAGATMTTNSGSLTGTFGQCPGCGTLVGNSGILTPGFQQPDGDTCFTAAFEFVEVSDACGTKYDFVYTGNANVNLVDLEWNFGAEGFPENSTQPNPTGVAFASNGIKSVSLIVSDGSCTKMVTLNIDVPSTGFSTNPSFSNVSCSGGSTGSIGIQVNGGTPPFNYEWSTGELSAAIEGLPAGDYAYTVTDATGCKTVNTATLSEPTDSIMIAASMASETCAGDLDGSIEVMASGGTPPLSLLWDNNETTPILTDLGSGIYTVTVTDGNGCTNESSVEVDQMCNPVIQGVLTPNGDGVNDEWEIGNIESFPDNEVAIFNRWGQRIWQQQGYTNNWTGTNDDGEILPVGAYYYVIHLNNDTNQVLSGSITIVR